MKNTFLILSVVAGLVIQLSSCTKETAAEPVVVTPDVCDSIPASFATDVMPIIQTNCTTCHNSSNNTANGQNWESYADVNANSVAILKAMKHESGVVAMPYQLDKLSDSLIQVIECWIDNGKLDN